MNEAFWSGFEKQAFNPLQAGARMVGAAVGGVQRGLSAGSGAMQRAAIQAKQRVSSGYRAGQRQGLGVSPKEYGAMRGGAQAAKPAAAAAVPAPAPAQSLLQRGAAAVKAHPVATAGAAAAGAAGIGYGLGRDQQQGAAI